MIDVKNSRCRMQRAAVWVAPRGSRRQPSTPQPARPFRWRTPVFLALLAGLLIFCHGCHGDVDNELFGGDGWVFFVSK